MKLSALSRRIIVATHLNAQKTVAQLAVECGVSTASVQYEMTKLREQEVLIAYPFINPSALGFEQFVIYLALRFTSAGQRAAISKHLARARQVVWFGSLSGAYQFGLSVLVRRSADLVAFMASLEARLGQAIVGKVILPVIGFAQCQKRYLSAECVFQEPVAWAAHPGPAVTCDDLDWRVLAALFSEPGLSHRALAQSLGAARATVDVRVRKLREKGVLVREIYRVPTTRLGFQTHRLLLSSNGPATELWESLARMVQHVPHISAVSRVLGSWDAEVTIEATDAAQAVTIIDSVCAALNRRLSGVATLSVLEQNVSFGVFQNEARRFA